MDAYDLITTADGSHTIYSHKFQAYYHSLHGALAESEKIYIEYGLVPLLNNSKPIRIFELGFGTGLNTWLSLGVSLQNKLSIEYTSLEAFPLPSEIWNQLNYPVIKEIPDGKSLFSQIHLQPWNSMKNVTEFFLLEKITCDWFNFSTEKTFDLVYFDAFGPSSHIEAWEMTSLEKLFHMMNTSGILLTFCAQGSFKRRLREIGFEVVNLPGPKGKREITKAIKH
ncbi:MAG: tRNA (5-methylaminomethyl-2-thiouridine)(34)-methyltransferase MnmD [Bacteroidota bacterium]|nr:tRNA (5-methylaminomethyl-2-thiouridine)(34)-methyltransferase MnmD [Bacteroidota bacterium]